MGALLAVDNNPIDSKTLRFLPNSYFLDLTRERVKDAIVAKLPKQKFRLLRLREVPRPQALTKLEQFEKDKGIVMKKKSKLT